MAVIEQERIEALKSHACNSPCICFNLRKASRIITQLYEDIFKPVGLTAPQVAMLNTVNKFEPVKVSELAKALCTDRTTLTRNIKPLERDGYLKIRQGQDKRSREVVITPKGKSTFERAAGLWQSWQAKIDQKIGQNKIESLCTDLANTLDQLEKIKE